jgi:hypothetical protein
MQFTLREITRVRVPLLIWLVLTVVIAVAGPFDTMQAMGLGGRALYWGGVVGCSVVLTNGATYLAGHRSMTGAVAVWIGFVLVLSAGFHVLNSAIFPVWGGLADWGYLTAIVGLVTAAVHLVIWGIFPQKPVVPAVPDATFQRRLQYEVRGPLVRIEAQDHYLNVVTQKGSALILMRLGDAIAELDGLGLQIHRSHWVAVQGVSKPRRAKGRDVLVMVDGAEVPVSRSFRAAAQEAGLL